MSRQPTPPVATVIVNARSQITLPQTVLAVLGATPGDQFQLTVAGDSLIVQRVNPRSGHPPADSLHHLVLGRRPARTKKPTS